MQFTKTELDGLVLIKPNVIMDNRGFFLESYSRKKFLDNGISSTFIQDNHSRSVKPGVIRGLHFQIPPAAQSKLIRVTRGAIYDVAVDIRPQSPTFGEWLGFELSEKNFHMLFIPSGFAHGFCSLEENTEIQYKVDNPYAPDLDRGIRWDDPDLTIKWPVSEPILSDKDAKLPFLKEIFPY